jgi:peptide/nickel transport system permease protein
MLRYVVKRIFVGSFVLAIVSAIVFGIFYILPADPARLACGKA